MITQIMLQVPATGVYLAHGEDRFSRRSLRNAPWERATEGEERKTYDVYCSHARWDREAVEEVLGR